MDYNKYLKYKTKYIKLKTEINIDSIYKYFISSNIVEFTENYNIIKEIKKRKITENNNEILLRYPKRNRISTNETIYIDHATELTPLILSYITPSKREDLYGKLQEDDDVIKELNDLIDENNLEYVNYENYGKLIEIWLADNMRCPCCGEKTLRRYARDNFPIIDLVCINLNHDDETVRFFQVKTSYLTNDSPSFLLNGEPYFSLKNNTIMVGSKKWGLFVHNIKCSDDIIKKKILIGYICILFKKSNDKIYINKKKSFIVLPYVNLSYNEDPDKTYYNYTDFSIHPQIYFDPDVNYVGNLEGNNVFFDNNIPNPQIYLDTHIIPINYANLVSNWTIIENPLNQI